MKRKINMIIVMILLSLLFISCNTVDRDLIDNRANEVPHDIQAVEEPVTMQDEEYSHKKVSIKYPQISGLADSNKQDKINELLKSEALVVVDSLYGGTEDVSMEINYKVMFKSNNLLSIQYQGYTYSNGAAYPVDRLYTINIDLNKGSEIMLKDYINIDENFVEKFRGFKVDNPDESQLEVEAFKYIIERHSAADLLRYFDGSDSSYEAFPIIFSYFTEDALGISIEVPHAVGDHTQIELKYQNIKDNIKAENEIWKDFGF